MKTALTDVHDLDGGRTRLRAVVATIDQEVLNLSRQAMGDDQSAKERGRLSSSWAELVKLLELGPAPQVRECPVCKRTGMREATRCGYCWAKLSAPAPSAIPA